MFWFFSQALASVLSTEWLKAVCSVRTVTVFKQGSLCLFKRMGKWLSWRIRLKKQDSRSLAQMSTFATWLAFWGTRNKSGLCARCSGPCLTPWPRVWFGPTFRPCVSGRAGVPRPDISRESLQLCHTIKGTEHRRNFSEDPVPMWFHLPSHAVPVASPRSREEGEQKLGGLARSSESCKRDLRKRDDASGAAVVKWKLPQMKRRKPDRSPDSSPY